MTYRYLKHLIIVATVFVWLRLLVGTAQYVTTEIVDPGNKLAVATEQKD